MRANSQQFKMRALRKVVMFCSRLCNKCKEDQTIRNWNKIRKHRNSCVNLFRRGRRSYHNKLGISLVTDNRFSQKTVKPFFSEKLQSKNEIALIEDKLSFPKMLM